MSMDDFGAGLTFDELGKPPHDIIRGRMGKKDPQLFGELSSLGFWQGCQRWRETYPEDFEGVESTTSLVDVARNVGRYIIPKTKGE